MKKNTLLLLALIVLITETFAKPKPVYFHFGNIRKDCRGLGICDIHDSPIREKSESFGTIDNTGSAVQLSIAYPPSEEVKQQIVNNSFTMEENLTLPSDIQRQLGLPDNFNIKAGKYPVVQSRDQLIITFGY